MKKIILLIIGVTVGIALVSSLSKYFWGVEIGKNIQHILVSAFTLYIILRLTKKSKSISA